MGLLMIVGGAGRGVSGGLGACFTSGGGIGRGTGFGSGVTIGFLLHDHDERLRWPAGGERGEHRRSQHPLDGQVFIEIVFSEKFGAGLAIAGLIIDTVGDCFFVLSSGLNFVLFLIIVILMNALATYGLYDGWERFHLGWIGWYQLRAWKWAVRQAALEMARGLANRR